MRRRRERSNRRILPALIDEAHSGLPRIFDKPVPIRVAKPIDPLQSRLDIWPDRGDRFDVPGPVEIHASQHDIERRRIDSPVIEPERHFAQTCHFPVPGFMQDLARLRAGERIKGFRLGRGEKAKNAFGDGRVQPQEQHGRDDSIASESRAVPRNARVGIKPPITCPRHQHVEVGGGLPADFIEKFVRTFDRRDAGRLAPDRAPPRSESTSKGIDPCLVPVLAKNRDKE